MIFLLVAMMLHFLSHPVRSVFSVPHQFCPLSSNGMISYKKMQNILVDFEHKETLISKSSLQITEQMKSLYEELQEEASSPPFHFCTRLLQGPSGAGKSTALLFLGHMARESGCIVFPIEARQFANVNDHELKINIFLFMKKWKTATGDDMLRAHMCISKPTQTLLEFVNEGLNWQGTCQDAVDFFESVVFSLRSIDEIPVVFLIDQCNAFCELQSSGGCCSRIAAMFLNWNIFRMNRGGIFYASSSSFRIMPAAKDGNHRLILQLRPMDKTSFESLLNEQVATGQLSTEFIPLVDDLYSHCAGLPRELLTFSAAFKENPDYDFQSLMYEHLLQRVDVYRNRISKLLIKEHVGKELVCESVTFACRLLMGEEMSRVPPIWAEAGMVVRKDRFYHLICKAAELALFHTFHDDTMRKALSIFQDDPCVGWRALELAFIYVFRMSMISGNSVLFTCTNLCGVGEKQFLVNIHSIHRSESAPQPCSIESGTLFVCRRNQALIDFFIHATDGSKIMVQVSEFCYAEHRAKWGLARESMLAEFDQAVKLGSRTAIKYIYITTSKILMRNSLLSRSKYFDPEVLLISNAEGAASKFFRNLIG